MTIQANPTRGWSVWYSPNGWAWNAYGPNGSRNGIAIDQYCARSEAERARDELKQPQSALEER
jgi:hypothetical protein